MASFRGGTGVHRHHTLSPIMRYVAAGRLPLQLLQDF